MYKTAFSLAVVWLSMAVNLLFAQDLSWENISRENLDFKALLVNPQDSKIIFAGQPGNLLKSDNAGESWQRVLAIRSRCRNINDLGVNKNNPGIVYAATDNGLYRSNNSGEHWERIFRGKNNQENQCTAVGLGLQAILVGTKAGLFISRDNGRSWYKPEAGIGNSGILNIDFGFDQDKIIYLAAESGIFKSLDGGQSWERLFVGSVEEKPEAEPVTDDLDVALGESSIHFIKADKNNPNLVYFASAKGVYKSLDQGKSWEKLTEYGLLNRDVKMLGCPDSLGVFALTPSGVFRYADERWMEISLGLAADRYNYLALDNLNNIYIAGGKGIYKSNQNNTSNSKGTSLIQEYLEGEPSIREVQEAAIKYAEVSPAKISQWRKDAAKKAILPQINIGLDRNSADLWHWEGGSTTKNDDDVLRRGRDNIDWDVSLSWDLGDLIFNDAQTSIDVRSKLMVELRDDILDQVNKLYFERLRVKSEIDNLALEDRPKRFQKQLKLEELAASLDALTSGYYSERMRLLAPKQ